MKRLSERQAAGRMERPTRWEPTARRDRTTEFRPPWDRLEDTPKAAAVAALPPMAFRLLGELCAATGWPAERGLDVVLRAAIPAPTQRRRTTTNARRFIGRQLGRRIRWDIVADEQLTEFRPPWDRLEDTPKAAAVAALPPMAFRLLGELCAATGWPAERGLDVVLRAAIPAPTQRRRTTTNARRFIGRQLGRRIRWDIVADEQLEDGV